MPNIIFKKKILLLMSLIHAIVIKNAYYVLELELYLSFGFSSFRFLQVGGNAE